LELLFFIKRVVSLALVPPIGFFVLALALWVVYLIRQQWRLWRGINLRSSREWSSSRGRANSLGSLLSVVVFLLIAGLASMTGFASSFLVNLVEREAGQPLDDEAAKTLMSRPSAPQALVILGGGSDFDAREPNGPFTLNAWTMRRVIHGTRLAKLTGLKVLVSGGVVPPHTKAEAQSMAEFMERELSYRATWQELRSRDTRDNASESARGAHAPLGDGV
jgi:uncharacterized SAM-binding protein YcdF (DUF218 family)